VNNFLLVPFIISFFFVGCVRKDLHTAFTSLGRVSDKAIVTSVSVTNNQLIIHGAGFSKITTVALKNSSLAFNESFAIESKSDSQIIANGLHGLSIVSNAFFDLILSSAQASSAYTVSFTVANGSITAAMLGSMGASAGQILKYNGSQWTPGDFAGSQTFIATWNASTDTPALPGSSNIGDYYIVAVGGIYNTVTYNVGDWIMYNHSGAWEKVTNNASSKLPLTGGILTGDLTVETQIKLKGGASFVTLKANPALAADVALTLPLTAGTDGYVLKTNGAGVLDWVQLPTSTAPSGSAGGMLSGSYPNPSIAGLDATKVGYLATVTSDLQAQLNTKQNSGVAITGLTGDVAATGPGSASAAVNSVGGKTAADIASAVQLANGATTANDPNTLVKRDGSGNFSATSVTGTVLVANGGTGATSLTAKGVLYGNGGSAISATASATSPSVLVSNLTTNLPEWTTSTATNFLQGSPSGVLFGPITNITPLADFTLTQNSVTPFISVNIGAVANTLSLNAGNVGIGTPSPTVSLDMGTRTDALRLPNGTTAQKPGTPTAGMIRYNTTNNAVEYYAATWKQVGVLGEGGVQSLPVPGTSGTAPNWSASSTAYTLNIPMASTAGVTAGLITKLEYESFNSKQTSITNSAGLAAALADETGTGFAVFNADPTFTGVPLSTTAAQNTNTSQIATTAFVLGQAGSTSPLMDGTAAVGSSLLYARDNHIHPTDTTRSPLAGSTSITTVGTIATGVWNGNNVEVLHGGTGTSTGSITGTDALTFTAGGANKNITLKPSGTGATIINGKLQLNGSASNYTAFDPGASPTTTTYLLPPDKGSAGQVLTTDGVANNTTLTWATPAITSANITDGTIMNIDINASAAIDYSKLNVPVGAIPVTALSVTEADGTKYLKGNSTWSVLQTDVLALTLSGYTIGTNLALSASDTIIGGFGKLQKQITDLLATSLSGDVTGAFGTTTISKLQNKTLTITTPANKNVLKYDGASWINSMLVATDLSSGGVAPDASTYLAGDNSWKSFEPKVLETQLTGLTATANKAVSTIALTDSILQAYGKLLFTQGDYVSKTADQIISGSLAINPTTGFITVPDPVNSLDAVNKQYLLSYALWTQGSPTTTNAVRTTGNVGIGIQPTYKLDVNGDVNIATGSAYKINGVNVLTTKGTYNYFLGDTGNTTTTGSYNTATGGNALGNNTSGGFNASYGYAALQNNQTGNYNTATGVQALIGNTAGTNNTAVGYNTLANTTGGYNTAIGGEAGKSNSIGTYNIFIGYNSGSTINSSLSNNVILGSFNGSGISNNNNVILSDGAGNLRLVIDTNGNMGIGLAAGVTPGSRLTVKGVDNLSSSSSLNVTDSTDNSDLFVRGDGNVGIGTTAPSAKLEVNGPIKTGTATIGNTCASEGMFAYDSAAHTPIFCTNGLVWQAMGNGITACPASWDMIGDAGKHGTYCIEHTARTAAVYTTALSTCFGINNSVGRAHLCDLSEWNTACQATIAGNGMPTSSEWISMPYSGSTAFAIGNNVSCSDVASSFYSTSIKYRCCIR
jgi:hypothetical protein